MNNLSLYVLLDLKNNRVVYKSSDLTEIKRKARVYDKNTPEWFPWLTTEYSVEIIDSLYKNNIYINGMLDDAMPVFNILNSNISKFLHENVSTPCKNFVNDFNNNIIYGEIIDKKKNSDIGIFYCSETELNTNIEYISGEYITINVCGRNIKIPVTYENLNGIKNICESNINILDIYKIHETRDEKLMRAMNFPNREDDLNYE